MKCDHLSKLYNDQILFKKRKGTPDDPYIPITQTLTIVNGKVHLKEIPNKGYRLLVIGEDIHWQEKRDGNYKELPDNMYQVDYFNGVVFFNASHENKSLTFKYLGEGVIYIPDSRVYLTDDENFEMLSDKFKEVDRLTIEQKNRVDSLIVNNPQPSEVVDLRVDKRGNLFNTARERVNFIQDEIEHTYVNTFNSKTFTNISERLNADFEELKSDLNQRSINVKEQGAVGNNTINNDTEIIQGCINQASLQGGGTVYVPGGTYLLTSPLSLYSNVTLILDSHAIFKRKHTGWMFYNGATGCTYDKQTGQKNITIQGGTYLMNEPGSFIEGGFFGIAWGENIKIKNVIVKDIVNGHVADINASENILIEDCKFLGFVDKTPDKSRRYADAIQIAPIMTVGFTAFGKFDGTPCNNVTVKDCYFGDSGTTGYYSWAVGVGNHGRGVLGSFSTNIKILDNHFEGLTYGAIHSHTFKGVLIKGNTFNNCVRSIILDNASALYESDGVTLTNRYQSDEGVTITNNQFFNTKKNNVFANGLNKGGVLTHYRNIFISNNYFKDQNLDKSYGDHANIRLYGIENILINDNIVENVNRGIISILTRNLTFRGNKVQNVINEALYFPVNSSSYASSEYNKNIIISENIFEKIGRSGILMHSTHQFKIQDNIFRDISTETDNQRDGIYVASFNEDGLVTGNIVKMAATGNTNKYGIEVKTNSSNILVFNNNVEGKTAVENIQSNTTNNTQGYIMNDKLGKHVVSMSNGKLKIDNNTVVDNAEIQWNDATLLNGYSLYDSESIAKYGMNALGEVFIKANIKGTDLSGSIMTIPSAMRPTVNIYKVIPINGSNSQTARICITFGGNVFIQQVSNTTNGLEHIMIDLSYKVY